MVEQLTLNQRVAGSSPARFTKVFRHLCATQRDAQEPTVARIVVGEFNNS
jgi:hypothetical protein